MRGVPSATTLREVKKLDEDRFGWAVRLVKEKKGGELKVQCGASTPGLLLAGYLPPEDLVEELWAMELMVREAREAALENLLT